MKSIRENLTYIFLGLVALVLIFVTISLQTSISATQSASSGAEDAGFVTTLRQQVAGWILPDATGDPGVTVSTGEQPTTGGAVEITAAPPVDTVNTTADLPTESAPVAGGGAAGTMEAALANAQNLTISEDNTILASVIDANRNAVGLFPYAYYLANQERLRAVAIRLPTGELIPPDVTTVAAGLYPLARPLYLYTSPTVIRAKPAVEALLGCFLNQLPTLVAQSGYMLPSRTLFAQAVQSFDATCQRCRREGTTIHPLAETVPICDFVDVPVDTLTVVGSATMAGLTSQMAERVRATGYGGEITVTSTTTGAGFERFCDESTGDIVAAGRPITSEERERCRVGDRSVLPFPVAVDALTVVVNRENTFLQSASIGELQQIFAYAQNWSDVNPQWPNEPILRALPGAQSGTFAFFVEAVMEEQALALLAERRNQPLAHPSDGVTESTPVGDQTAAALRAVVGDVVGTAVFVEKNPRVRIGYTSADSARGPECAIITEYIALILEGNFGLQVELRPFAEVNELFATLAAKDAAERIDLTFCYLDPLDRSYRQRYFGYTEFIDSGYRQIGENRLVIMTNSVIKPALERENRCLFQFLDGLDLEGVSLSAQTPLDWYRENQATIAAWLPCAS